MIKFPWRATTLPEKVIRRLASSAVMWSADMEMGPDVFMGSRFSPIREVTPSCENKGAPSRSKVKLKRLKIEKSLGISLKKLRYLVNHHKNLSIHF
jgi:hypothetical protein